MIENLLNSHKLTPPWNLCPKLKQQRYHHLSNGINRVLIIGRVGDNPRVNQSSNGTITNVSVATNEQWKDKQTGEQKERVEWHRIVFFGRLAEIVGQYVVKGSQIYVSGALRTREWNKEGVTHRTTEIVGAEMQMIGSKPSPTTNTPIVENDSPVEPWNHDFEDVPF